MLHRHASGAVAAHFLLGSLLGAATTSFGLTIVAGLISPVPHGARAATAVVGLGILILRELRVVEFALPENRRQIPRETFNRRPARAAFRFAFELGTGVRTYVTTSAPYALALVLVLAPRDGTVDALTGAGAVAVGYGLGRSLVVMQNAALGRPAVEPPRWALRFSAMLALVAVFAAAARAI